MGETKDIQENENKSDVPEEVQDLSELRQALSEARLLLHTILDATLIEKLHRSAALAFTMAEEDYRAALTSLEQRPKARHHIELDKRIFEDVRFRSLVSKDEPIKIQLRIIEEPLTPQNLALILTALTELTTKLWLIEKHRFADLIEYTQTHDILFANEAGTVITRVSYNSPFNFDWKVDLSAPSVAEAVMTVVDGLSQRKAHLEKLEIENMAAAQKIREAEENLKQQQEMAAIEREKQEIALEKLRLGNERERQTLVEQRLESQRKQIEDAIELAGKAVDIVYPNADAEIRPMLIQTVMNNILQLLSATGLELILILPENKDQDNPKEDV